MQSKVIRHQAVTTPASAHAPATPHPHGVTVSRAQAIAAVLALSLGCFSFVSTELMPVGVLPAMAAGLNVSLGAAGYLVTIFAFMVALTAAPLTGLLGSLNRKTLMAGLLAVCCIGNLITFLAPNYFVVFLGRILHETQYELHRLSLAVFRWRRCWGFRLAQCSVKCMDGAPCLLRSRYSAWSSSR